MSGGKDYTERSLGACYAACSYLPQHSERALPLLEYGNDAARAGKAAVGIAYTVVTKVEVIIQVRRETKTTREYTLLRRACGQKAVTPVACLQCLSTENTAN
jgi:hypothetical protein